MIRPLRTDRQTCRTLRATRRLSKARCRSYLWRRCRRSSRWTPPARPGGRGKRLADSVPPRRCSRGPREGPASERREPPTPRGPGAHAGPRRERRGGAGRGQQGSPQRRAESLRRSACRQQPAQPRRGCVGFETPSCSRVRLLLRHVERSIRCQATCTQYAPSSCDPRVCTCAKSHTLEAQAALPHASASLVARSHVNLLGRAVV